MCTCVCECECVCTCMCECVSGEGGPGYIKFEFFFAWCEVVMDLWAGEGSLWNALNSIVHW